MKNLSSIMIVLISIGSIFLCCLLYIITKTTIKARIAPT